MVAAMTAVKGGVHIKRAAEEHGVPASTLRDRISRRVVHGTKPGPNPYLSSTEESELSSFLQSCSNVGYGKTRTMVTYASLNATQGRRVAQLRLG